MKRTLHAHDRLLALAESYGITSAQVVERQQRYATGARAPADPLRSWAWGPLSVFAFVELVIEAERARPRTPV